MARILLKTTIPPTDDDWSIARFSLLRQLLAKHHDVDARDRVVNDAGDDCDLTGLGAGNYDQLWLFAVDVTDALTDADVAGIEAFRNRGGGLMLTRDHFDMGTCLSKLSDVGVTHHFHSVNPESEKERQSRDDPHTETIDWPNYHSGRNGDYQQVDVVMPLHPLLTRADGTAIQYLPSHPHEGAVSAPASMRSAARVIACGRSLATGRAFNIAVAVESDSTENGRKGKAVAEATFHRFADYNWDPSYGAPSFVDEPPGDGIRLTVLARNDALQYAVNIAEWLTDRTHEGRRRINEQPQHQR